MDSKDEVFLFLAPEVERSLENKGIEVRDLIRMTNLPVEMRFGENPSIDAIGKKDPAIVLLASAAVIAALTPLLREALKQLSGRIAVVRERRLVPVEDSHGKVVHDAAGEPVLHWVDVVKDVKPENQSAQPVKIGGLGVEITFGG